MKTVEQLAVKIFADGADLAGMLEMYRKPFIRGFTTNPTLMNKAGIRDYREFAKQVVRAGQVSCARREIAAKFAGCPARK